MIYDNENLGKVSVEANDNFIELSSGDIKITLNFKKKFNSKEFEINKKTNLIDYINWDVGLSTKETYYLFDISKDKVYLTRLDDNLYNIEIVIEKPDMIYTPLGDNVSFKNLKINTNFSFEEAIALDKWKFGIANDKLISLVLSNKKRATSSLYEENMKLPVIGEKSIICYDDGKDACTVKTIDYKIMKFNEMTEEYAKLEGEGNLSLDYWKKVHYDFFKSINPNFNEESKIVFEVFKLVNK